MTAFSQEAPCVELHRETEARASTLPQPGQATHSLRTSAFPPSSWACDIILLFPGLIRKFIYSTQRYWAPLMCWLSASNSLWPLQWPRERMTAGAQQNPHKLKGGYCPSYEKCKRPWADFSGFFGKNMPMRSTHNRGLLRSSEAWVDPQSELFLGLEARCRWVRCRWVTWALRTTMSHDGKVFRADS